MAVYLGSNKINYFGDKQVNIKFGSDVYLITFMIDGISYQAEAEMTWGKFINSKYNTLGLKVFSQDPSMVANSDESKVLSPDGASFWYVSDIIDPAVSYTLMAI